MICVTDLINSKPKKDWGLPIRLFLLAAIAFFVIPLFQGCVLGPQKPTTLKEINHDPCPPEQNFQWGNPPPEPSPEPSPTPEPKSKSGPTRIPFRIKFPV